jgi:diaminopimelate decarboxylase
VTSLSDHVNRLVRSYWAVQGGSVVVGGIPIQAIADRFATPLFVYDAAVMDRKWSQLRDTFAERFAIYYSVKANPNRSILRHFLAKGSGLEIASGGELHQAIQAGCPPRKILYAGPGKTESELELALKQGIGEFHVESALEARRISALCRRLGVTAYVALRINPSEAAQGGAMRMGGKPAPFGVDEEESVDLVRALEADSAIHFSGIHLFVGTQILDANVLLAQYRKGIEIARRIAETIRRPLQTVDFGGGFGIPYFPQEHELDLERLRDGIEQILDEVGKEELFDGTRFVIEPGRFLVGEAGLYVARVTDVKVSRGKTFVVLDGGMNHHLAASGNLGQVIKRNFPVAVLNKIDAPAREHVDVVGPLCTPLDTLARDISFPKVEVGDLIGVFQSGAYARTASPLAFLSHRTPAEVLIEDGQVREIRQRGTYEALCADMP